MFTPSIHPASMDPQVLLRDCEVKATRRGGPGGQHRNKVQTAIVLRHRPTGLQAEASEQRSQAANRAAALFRLRLMLAMHVRTEWKQPSELWRRRTAGGSIAINPSHEDFPAMLAEALDALAAREWDVAVAADRLGSSNSQLVRLLKKHPPALEELNRQREERHLKPLR